MLSQHGFEVSFAKSTTRFLFADDIHFDRGLKAYIPIENHTHACEILLECFLVIW